MPGGVGVRLLLDVLIFLLAGIAGGFIGYRLMKARQFQAHNEAETRVTNARVEEARIIAEAKSQAKTEELTAQQRKVQVIEEADQEIIRRRREMERAEERIQRRQEALDQKMEQLESRDRKLNQRQTKLEKRETDLLKMEEQHAAELERIAAMSRDDAKQELLAAVEQETRQEMARKIREVEAETQAHADAKAREVITWVMERVASEHVSETTVASVPLPADEMKGRIIGRQGRNIRSIEMATGVDLVVDDTPEAIIISSFDPVRREVARIAIGRLVADGRIHPARVEKEVEKAREEVEKSIKEAGEQAVMEVGLQGLHPEIIKLLGRLKFRTSYGQNQLAHAVEATHIAAMLAAELGANIQLSKMGALLHDLGKAVSHEVEGTHSKLGSDLARKYGESENICHAIEAHHQDIEPKTLLAVLVQAADAISATRPGARRETLETYVKRLEKLEAIADSFKGVAKAYAIQAGREIRVMVQPEKVTDAQAAVMARDITKKIEEGLEYPGQIKVTVVRETRAIEYAK